VYTWVYRSGVINSWEIGCYEADQKNFNPYMLEISSSSSFQGPKLYFVCYDGEQIMQTDKPDNITGQSTPRFESTTQRGISPHFNIF
jgi:hypothetical protein